MRILSMIALECALSADVNPLARFFAEILTTDKQEDLQNELGDCSQKIVNIQNRADGEKRGITKEEKLEIDELFARAEELEEELDRRKKTAELNARIGQGQGRRTAPGGGDPNPGNGNRPLARTKESWENDPGKHGFRSLGEFAQKVKSYFEPGGNSNGRMDPRLVSNAPTTAANEGSGADGGFLLPPDFRQAIYSKVMGEASLIGRTDQLQTSSNSITIPKDETTPWQTTGGIQAYWESELALLSQSKPSLEMVQIRLNKLTALVPVSSEMMEDAPSLASYLNKKAPEKMDFRVTDAIVNGTGVGMPLGLTKSSAKIAQAKESAQTADTVVYNNIVKMWSRLYSGCRANAIWLINQDIEPQLNAMQFPGSGTAVPAYMPPGGLSQSPYGTLMGRPVVPTEACQTLGDEGDIILTDLKTYLTATKVGGVRSDVSIHLYFDYDATAFRFIFRVAGQPWWTTSIAPKNGSNTRSCIVTLAERA